MAELLLMSQLSSQQVRGSADDPPSQRPAAGLTQTGATSPDWRAHTHTSAQVSLHT